MSAGSMAPRRLVRSSRETAPAHAWLSPTTVALAGITALGALLRFYRLAHQGYWYDEANTALLVHLSAGSMLGLLPQNESTPPLYYCVAWAWARIFGFGEAGLRSLSALAGTAVVPIAYGIGARIATRRVGLILAALTACNPLLVWYSQEARSYELLVLFCAAGLLAFVWALDDPRPRPLAGWALASALALLTHYYAILAVIPETLWLLARHRRSRATWAAVAGVGVVGAALIPLALSQNATNRDGWIAPIPFLPRLEQVSPNFLLGFDSPHHVLLVYGALAIVALALVLALTVAGRPERRAAGVGAGLAIGGLLLNLIIVAAGVDDLITRNLLALWPAAGLAVAAGLGGRRLGAVGLLGAGLLCAGGVYVNATVALDRFLQRPDWRPVARSLGPAPPAGSLPRAILVQDYRDMLPLSLYMPGIRRFHWYQSVRVRELEVVTIRAPRVNLCWYGAACNLTGSRAQSSYPIPGLRTADRRRVRQFTIITLRGPRPVLLTRSVLRRALRSTVWFNDEVLIQSSR